jgi:5'-nucleotidase
MENNRPLILVTNDDGYSSKGITELIAMAQRIGDVVVVAPDAAQSGKSHAITFSNYIRVKTITDEPNLKVYSVTGTPVDCVKMAINRLLDRQPDLLLSGINHGTNSTVCAFYSGTLGAATEGAMNGIPSVGVSLCSFDLDSDFSVVVKHTEPILKRLLATNTDKNLCLNINFPYIPETDFLGMKICRQADGLWKEDFIEYQDPSGRPFYWLSGEFINNEPDSADTDEWALAHGYASIVPINLDSTDYARLKIIDYLL